MDYELSEIIYYGTGLALATATLPDGRVFHLRRNPGTTHWTAEHEEASALGPTLEIAIDNLRRTLEFPAP